MLRVFKKIDWAGCRKNLMRDYSESERAASDDSDGEPGNTEECGARISKVEVTGERNSECDTSLSPQPSMSTRRACWSNVCIERGLGDF